MQLRRLAALERQKIEDEYREVRELIQRLLGILEDPKKVLTIIKKELAELAEKYGDERRTAIVPHGVGEFNEEDLIEESNVYVTLTRGGYIKRMAIDTYRQQARGGKGIIGMTTKEEDVVEHLLVCSTHSTLLFFTNRGRVFKLKAYEIPEASRTAKGQAIVNLLQVGQEENVQSIINLEKFDSKLYLFFATRRGVVKKTALDEYENIRSTGIIAINLGEGDELASVQLTDGDKEVIMITRKALSIRFKESDVRAMGRSSTGVKGIRLAADDVVISACVIDPAQENIQKVCVLSTNGYGKSTLIKEYPVQGRGGKGVFTARLNAKTGPLASAIIADPGMIEDLVVISKDGQVIRLPFRQVNTLGRATSGVRVMRLHDGDAVAGFTAVADEAEVAES
jgi:DNA gyrase subunit A